MEKLRNQKRGGDGLLYLLIVPKTNYEGTDGGLASIVDLTIWLDITVVLI